MADSKNAVSRIIRYHPARYAIRLLKWEVGQYADLARWVSGRRDIPEATTPIYYHRAQLQLARWMTALIVVEIIVVHLLLPTFLWQVIAGVVSIYSLMLMWAVIASRAVRPHLFNDQIVVLRYGRKIVATIPLRLVSHARRERSYEGEWWSVADEVLTLGTTEGTNMVLELSEPVHVMTPSYPWQRKEYALARRIRVWGDNADSPHFQEWLSV